MRIFSVKYHVRHQGCPINLVRLLDCPVQKFVILGFLGQRNPLTADMSSEICCKISFVITMCFIVTIYFSKSNECLPFLCEYDKITLTRGI